MLRGALCPLVSTRSRLVRASPGESTGEMLKKWAWTQTLQADVCPGPQADLTATPQRAGDGRGAPERVSTLSLTVSFFCPLATTVGTTTAAIPSRQQWSPRWGLWAPESWEEPARSFRAMRIRQVSDWARGQVWTQDLSPPSLTMDTHLCLIWADAVLRRSAGLRNVRWTAKVLGWVLGSAAVC